MSETIELLEFAKRVVVDAANAFMSGDRDTLSQVAGVEVGGREIKLLADKVIESSLLSQLLSSGLTVLSEESGLISQGTDTLRWIVDPLDGSVNFLKRIGPSAISVALWREETPIFGVLFNLDERILAWGGRGIGAWVDGQPVHVSSQSRIDQAILCTGIPARLDVNNDTVMKSYLLKIAAFAKVRMIGSAACSLLLLARGAVDAYFEDQIMLWDIAGGLALVEGAGGHCSIRAGNSEFSRTVLAMSPTMQSDAKKCGLS